VNEPSLSPGPQPETEADTQKQKKTKAAANPAAKAEHHLVVVESLNKNQNQGLDPEALKNQRTRDAQNRLQEPEDPEAETNLETIDVLLADQGQEALETAAKRTWQPEKDCKNGTIITNIKTKEGITRKITLLRSASEFLV